MGAGRKLKTHRRRQKWADKSYKKSHLGNEWKKPFAGSSHAKGIVLEKMCVYSYSSLFNSDFFLAAREIQLMEFILNSCLFLEELKLSNPTLPSGSVPEFN